MEDRGWRKLEREVICDSRADSIFPFVYIYIIPSFHHGVRRDI